MARLRSLTVGDPCYILALRRRLPGEPDHLGRGRTSQFVSPVPGRIKRGRYFVALFPPAPFVLTSSPAAKASEAELMQ